MSTIGHCNDYLQGNIYLDHKPLYCSGDEFQTPLLKMLECLLEKHILNNTLVIIAPYRPDGVLEGDCLPAKDMR